jgi:hypothetical protein
MGISRKSRTLMGEEAASYSKALTVARGVYHGTIEDPMRAHFFQSIPDKWFINASKPGGTIVEVGTIGSHTFYRLK